MITVLLHLLRLLPFLIGSHRQLALENLALLFPFLCGGHRQLALEKLALRQQLAIYKRTLPRPRLHTTVTRCMASRFATA